MHNTFTCMYEIAFAR